jgi:hypothetical protein
VSRPRKPFGPNPPGRLLATMLRVLAAESSDAGRLSRGRRYHADDAVIDLVVGRGVVTAEIQGSRPDPYVVTIETEPGRGTPGRRELWVQCTCPDDTGTGTDFCKHAVAAMFALGDEVSIEPELLDRWRSGRRRTVGGADVAAVTELDEHRHAGAANDRDDRRPTSRVGGRMADVIRFPGTPAQGDGGSAEPDDDPEIDLIAVLLRAPDGASPPALPALDPIEHRSLPDQMVREVLEDALDHLHLRWE